MNTPVPPASGHDTRSALERGYDRIANHLTAVWHDKDEATRYLDSLVIDERCDRQGFPMDVFEELMFLTELRWQMENLNASGVEVSLASFSFQEPAKGLAKPR